MRLANMIEQKGLGVLKKEKDSPSPSRFQDFDDALDKLTRKLYNREYYNIPSSFISVLYNLELHRFQTIASSSWSSYRNSDANTRTDEENDKARYLSTRISIVEIKTNRNESTYQMQPSKNTSCTSSISIYL
jgi:hypothetical protein